LSLAGSAGRIFWGWEWTLQIHWERKENSSVFTVGACYELGNKMFYFEKSAFFVLQAPSF
jgi:hypothetical protein